MWTQFVKKFKLLDIHVFFENRAVFNVDRNETTVILRYKMR